MTNQNEVVLQEGIIYMIECKDSAIREFYVGSTLKTYSSIRDRHKYESKVKKTKLYNFINNNGQWNNWNVNVIEFVYVKNKLDLRLHEQSWIDTLEPQLNSNNAYCDRVEYEKFRDNKLNQIFIQCSNCDKSYTNRRKQNHMRSKYCNNYNSTTSESFIESDTESN